MANGLGETREKVTIKHVAKDAGVSVAAVSKVTRNAYGVSDKLRTKVMKSIEKLGYRPSTAAQAMRGRTYTTGVLLLGISNSFLTSVVDGLKTELKSANYKFLIGVGEAQEALEKELIDSMIDLRMDGIILVAPRLSSEMLDRYAKQIPMVVIGHHETEFETFDTVNSDDVAGAKLAVQALIEKGHQRIHMISLRSTAGTNNIIGAREHGYAKAMQDAGHEDEIKIWPIRESLESVGEPIETVFNLDPIPDAFFCWSDLHAVDLICKAKLRGLKVPQDLAIVGYDNNLMAQLPLIDLSSVDQDGEQIGELAAATLLSRISGREEALHLLVDPTLAKRSSC